MSIATLKRKSHTQYHNLSVGQKGFSLNGGYRNQGYVGQENRSRFLSRTLMKGNVIKGHGGCCGKYPVGHVVQTSVSTTEQHNVIKPSVVGTSGQIATQYRWIRRPQPYITVKPDINNNINTQHQYIENKQKAILSCNIVKPVVPNKCRKCSVPTTNYNNFNRLQGLVMSDPTKTKISSQSDYVNALAGKCANNKLMNIKFVPRPSQGKPVACQNVRPI
jgi:hypothetical protein